MEICNKGSHHPSHALHYQTSEIISSLRKSKLQGSTQHSNTRNSIQKDIGPKSTGEIHTPNLFLKIGTRIAHYDLFPSHHEASKRQRENSNPPHQQRKAGWYNIFFNLMCFSSYAIFFITIFNVFNFKSSLLHTTPQITLLLSMYCFACRWSSVFSHPFYSPTLSTILTHDGYTYSGLPLFCFVSSPFIPLFPSQQQSST